MPSRDKRKRVRSVTCGCARQGEINSGRDTNTINRRALAVRSINKSINSSVVGSAQ